MLGTLLALAEVVGATASPEPTAPLVCRRTKTLRPSLEPPDSSLVPSAPGVAVSVHDRFDHDERPRSIGIGRLRTLCTPASGAPAPAGNDALATFRVHPLPGASLRPVGVDYSLETPLGDLTLRVKALERLLVTAATAPRGEQPDGFDLAGVTRHTCYRARAKAGTRAERLDLTTADGTWSVRVARPRRLCVPAATSDVLLPEYLCWKAKRRRKARQPGRTTRETTTVFGRELVRLGTATEVCLPATLETPPPPEPGFTLLVEPATRDIEWRERAAFRAIARWDDGREEDVTERVTWTSDTPAIAAPARDDPGVFHGREPGALVVRATEAVTGATAEARLAVRWSLERIELHPRQVNRAIGQQETYQATGFFPGDVEHNVTGRLVYATSDPAVAVPDGPASTTPSRVVPVHHGTVTVSACDPRSGVCSGDAGGDAAMIVFGGLQSLEVTPRADITVALGRSLPLTAIGRFADGRVKNLTRRVDWQAEDPTVVEPGAHGVLVGLAPGQTRVRAVDPQTGLASERRRVSVLGELAGIEVYGGDTPYDWRRVGESLRLTALGLYAGGGTRNLTQEVLWSSRDPSRAVARNHDGDRSRIDAVGPGDARVLATDPRSGISSDDETVHVLGDLVSLELTRRPDIALFPAGARAELRVSGTFAGGEHLDFLLLRPDDLDVVSSAPEVAAMQGARWLRARAGGQATVSARDRRTGIVSNPWTMTVLGHVGRISLDPPTITRGIGEEETYNALGHHALGLTSWLTQDLVYSSSDENVAVATNEPGNASRVVTVGPGTAVISALDPRTGVSTTGTGDDATITVLPGALERVTISPPVRLLPVGGFDGLTATGHYPDGRTINVTSQVAWTSSEPAVAAMQKECASCRDRDQEPGGRSRVYGRAPGTVLITATHPSGVSSSHTGHDAIILVDDVAAVDVLPGTATARVGETLPFRARATLRNGTTLDATDQTVFWTDPASVARVTPESAVLAWAPGTATVYAQVGTGPVGQATLTVLPPELTTTTTSTSTTTTLPAGATLVIQPAALTVDFGEPAHFRALFEGTGSSMPAHADVTGRVEWSVVDGTIAAGAGGVFETLDPGTTTIVATDPVTGASASATLTVDWTLRQITVYPRNVIRQPGGFERFTAIGEFAGGRTLDLTDRVTFAVSDGHVARIATESEHPGEVVALATGETAVVACDPRSAICSAGSGAATFRVTPNSPDRFLSVSPDDIALLPGRHVDLTVRLDWIGSDTAQDVTDLVSWELVSELGDSGGPDPVRLVREGPSGLRLYALAPGRAGVRFEYEGETQLIDVYVIGRTTRVSAHVPTPVEVGTSVFGTAYGDDGLGGRRNLTQLVEWRTLTPSIIAVSTDPGAPSRLDAVGIGTGRVVAHDPASGIDSDPVGVTVYGTLTRLDTLPNDSEAGPTRLTLGAVGYYNARAIYEGGYVLCVTCGNPTQPVRLVSSDPSVVAIVSTPPYSYATVRAVGSGTATVNYEDVKTGISGLGHTITVVGGLERLELRPGGEVVRGIGEHEWLTAIGHYPPDVTSNLTQAVFYQSSDTAVATVSNTAGKAGEIRTVGPGTAVISATYRGVVSSTDTGDDVTVTVLPGTLERIVVSPPFTRRMVGDSEEFTAVGYYPDGTVLNVTQQVEWTVGASPVAAPFGPPNRRSLLRATAPGTTTITATHPSGVSSADTGADATMEADAVVGLTIDPPTRVLVPGQTEEFTVIASMARGETRNATQLADYVAWPLESGVLEVPNADPRRSLVRAVAPGTVDVVASFGGQMVSAHVTVVDAAPVE